MYEINFKKSKQLKRFKKSLDKIDDYEVQYGYFPDSGYHRESGLLLSELMAIHEKNSDKSLRRPILSIAGAKVNDGELDKDITKALSKFMVNAKKSTSAHRKFYHDIGEDAVTHLQKLFGKSISYKGMSIAPNRPSTVKKKGFNSPLVETGQLKKGVKYKIRKRST